jgi:nucleoside-diphosphate-sugar epimerase
MRVLVLGGTGLISTAITEQLLAGGFLVTHLHRNRGRAVAGVSTVYGDRSSPADLARAWGAGQDAVIDMLCFTAADARLAVDAFGGRAAHYVMCSTVDVYTKPARYLPVDEKHERHPSPTFRYALGKAQAEAVLRDAPALPVTVLRPAATYLDSAVPSIGSFDLAVERLRAGRPVILHGDGGSRWAACHRDDVARAFVAALGREPVGAAYNVTGAEALTFEQYWRAVADALGVTPSFVYLPTDLLARYAPRLAEWCAVNFRYDNVFDCTAAARDLGFASTIRWADGIATGLATRAAQPVDPAERRAYDSIVDGWRRATTALGDELLPEDL